MSRILCLLLFTCAISSSATGAPPAEDRAAFLDLAKKGWVYQLRTAMWRHDPLVPPIVINGRDQSGAAICVLGERPHPRTRFILDRFRALMADVFGKPLPLRYAGDDLGLCGSGRSVYIRLYSGRPPQDAFNDDLRRMDEIYVFGLPKGREQFVMSPAQAQTFFGRRGQATHVLVKQPKPGDVSPLEAGFYASILIEELYQTFTFGMDVLHFNRDTAFVSKLEEYPVNLRHLPWESDRYMQGLLQSNPNGLCPFDVFMLHALAGSSVESTNSEAFLAYIATEFDRIGASTARTLVNPDYAAILDPGCTAIPPN